MAYREVCSWVTGADGNLSRVCRQVWSPDPVTPSRPGGRSTAQVRAQQRARAAAKANPPLTPAGPPQQLWFQGKSYTNRQRYLAAVEASRQRGREAARLADEAKARELYQRRLRHERALARARRIAHDALEKRAREARMGGINEQRLLVEGREQRETESELRKTRAAQALSEDEYQRMPWLAEDRPNVDHPDETVAEMRRRQMLEQARKKQDYSGVLHWIEEQGIKTDGRFIDQTLYDTVTSEFMAYANETDAEWRSIAEEAQRLIQSGDLAGANALMSKPEFTTAAEAYDRLVGDGLNNRGQVGEFQTLTSSIAGTRNDYMERVLLGQFAGEGRNLLRPSEVEKFREEFRETLEHEFGPMHEDPARRMSLRDWVSRQFRLNLDETRRWAAMSKAQRLQELGMTYDRTLNQWVMTDQNGDQWALERGQDPFSPGFDSANAFRPVEAAVRISRLEEMLEGSDHTMAEFESLYRRISGEGPGRLSRIDQGRAQRELTALVEEVVFDWRRRENRSGIRNPRSAAAAQAAGAYELAPGEQSAEELITEILSWYGVERPGGVAGFANTVMNAPVLSQILGAADVMRSGVRNALHEARIGIWGRERYGTELNLHFYRDPNDPLAGGIPFAPGLQIGFEDPIDQSNMSFFEGAQRGFMDTRTNEESLAAYDEYKRVMDNPNSSWQDRIDAILFMGSANRTGNTMMLFDMAMDPLTLLGPSRFLRAGMLAMSEAGGARAALSGLRGGVRMGPGGIPMLPQVLTDYAKFVTPQWFSPGTRGAANVAAATRAQVMRHLSRDTGYSVAELKLKPAAEVQELLKRLATGQSMREIATAMPGWERLAQGKRANTQQLMSLAAAELRNQASGLVLPSSIRSMVEDATKEYEAAQVALAREISITTANAARAEGGAALEATRLEMEAAGIRPAEAPSGPTVLPGGAQANVDALRRALETRMFEHVAAARRAVEVAERLTAKPIGGMPIMETRVRQAELENLKTAIQAVDLYRDVPMPTPAGGTRTRVGLVNQVHDSLRAYRRHLGVAEDEAPSYSTWNTARISDDVAFIKDQIRFARAQRNAATTAAAKANWQRKIARLHASIQGLKVEKELSEGGRGVATRRAKTNGAEMTQRVSANKVARPILNDHGLTEEVGRELYSRRSNSSIEQTYVQFDNSEATALTKVVDDAYASPVRGVTAEFDNLLDEMGRPKITLGEGLSLLQSLSIAPGGDFWVDSLRALADEAVTGTGQNARRLVEWMDYGHRARAAADDLSGYVRVDTAVKKAVKATPGRGTRKGATRAVGKSTREEGQAFVLRDTEPAVVLAKVRVLRKHGMTIEQYDEMRSVLGDIARRDETQRSLWKQAGGDPVLYRELREQRRAKEAFNDFEEYANRPDRVGLTDAEVWALWKEEHSLGDAVPPKRFITDYQNRLLEESYESISGHHPDVDHLVESYLGGHQRMPAGARAPQPGEFGGMLDSELNVPSRVVGDNHPTLNPTRMPRGFRPRLFKDRIASAVPLRKGHRRLYHYTAADRAQQLRLGQEMGGPSPQTIPGHEPVLGKGLYLSKEGDPQWTQQTGVDFDELQQKYVEVSKDVVEVGVDIPPGTVMRRYVHPEDLREDLFRYDIATGDIDGWWDIPEDWGARLREALIEDGFDGVEVTRFDEKVWGRVNHSFEALSADQVVMYNRAKTKPVQMERGFRVVVGGDPAFPSSKFVRESLDSLLKKHPDLIIVTGGGTKGVESMAEQWAHTRGVPVRRRPADWSQKDAGFKRNEQMMREDIGGVALFEIGPANVRPTSTIGKSIWRAANQEKIPIWNPDAPFYREAEVKELETKAAKLRHAIQRMKFQAADEEEVLVPAAYLVNALDRLDDLRARVEAGTYVDPDWAMEIGEEVRPGLVSDRTVTPWDVTEGRPGHKAQRVLGVSDVERAQERLRELADLAADGESWAPTKEMAQFERVLVAAGVEPIGEAAVGRKGFWARGATRVVEETRPEMRVEDTWVPPTGIAEERLIPVSEANRAPSTERMVVPVRHVAPSVHGTPSGVPLFELAADHPFWKTTRGGRSVVARYIPGEGVVVRAGRKGSQRLSALRETGRALMDSTDANKAVAAEVEGLLSPSLAELRVRLGMRSGKAADVAAELWLRRKAGWRLGYPDAAMRTSWDEMLSGAKLPDVFPPKALSPETRALLRQVDEAFGRIDETVEVGRRVKVTGPRVKRVKVKDIPGYKSWSKRDGETFRGRAIGTGERQAKIQIANARLEALEAEIGALRRGLGQGERHRGNRGVSIANDGIYVSSKADAVTVAHELFHAYWDDPANTNLVRDITDAIDALGAGEIADIWAKIRYGPAVYNEAEMAAELYGLWRIGDDAGSSVNMSWRDLLASLDPVTKFQVEVMGERFRNLGNITDRWSFGHHHPPFGNRAKMRDWLVENGFWSPQTADDIASGRRIWTIDEERQFWKSNYGYDAPWTDPAVLKPLLEDPEKYFAAFREWGFFADDMEVLAANPALRAIPMADRMTFGIDGVKATRSYEDMRHWFEGRYGSLVVDDAGKFTSVPWLMNMTEYRGWLNGKMSTHAGLKELGLNINQSLLSVEELASFSRILQETMAEHIKRFEKRIAEEGGDPDVWLPEEQMRLAYGVVDGLLRDRGWMSFFDRAGLTKRSMLIGQFQRTMIIWAPAFPILNLIDAFGPKAALLSILRNRGRWIYATEQRWDEWGPTLDHYGNNIHSAWGIDAIRPSSRVANEAFTTSEQIRAAGQMVVELPLDLSERAEAVLRLNFARSVGGRTTDDLLATGMDLETAILMGRYEAHKALDTFFSSMDNAPEWLKIANQIVPFLSYQYKNSLMGLRVIVEQPWLLAAGQRLGNYIEGMNRANWKKEHPYEAFPEQYDPQQLWIDTPWGTTYRINLSMFGDWTRAMAGLDDKGLFGPLGVFRVPHPWQTAVIGLITGQKTAWGAEPDIRNLHPFFEFFDIFFGGHTYDENNPDTLDLMQIVSKMLFFKEFGRVLPVSSLITTYFALRQVDQAKAYEYYRDNPEIGAYFQLDGIDGPGLFDTKKFSWHAFATEEEREAFDEAQTELDRIEAHYDARLAEYYTQPWSREYRELKAERRAAIALHIRNNPVLEESWMWSDARDWVAEGFEEFQTDVLVDDYFSIPKPKRADYDSDLLFEQANLEYLEGREAFLKANPLVYEALFNSENAIEQAWFAHELQWSEIMQEQANVRIQIAMEEAKPTPDRDRLDVLYAMSDANYKRLDAESFGMFYDQLGVDLVDNQPGMVRDILNKGLGRVREMVVFPGRKDYFYEIASDTERVQIVEDEKYHTAVGDLMDELKGKDDFGSFWTEMRSRGLLDRYLRENPGKKIDFEYSTAISRIFAAGDPKKFWDRLMSEPRWLNEYLRRNPEKQATYQKVLTGRRYFNEMQGLWGRIGDDFSRFYDELAKNPWLQQQYFQRNPEKAGNRGGSTSAYGIAISGIYSMAKDGDQFFTLLRQNPALMAEYLSRHPDQAATYRAGSEYYQQISGWVEAIKADDFNRANDLWNAMPGWVQERYLAKHPDSGMRGDSPQNRRAGVQGVSYSASMGQWVELLQAGKYPEADDYFKALPSWMQERYFQKHPDQRAKHQLTSDMLRAGAEYFLAPQGDKQHILEANPQLGQWLKENGGNEAAMRGLIFSIYREIPTSEAWLKRKFRLNYPEFFGAEAVGQRKLDKVMKTLAEHPEMLPFYEKAYALQVSLYQEQLKRSKVPPRPLTMERKSRYKKRKKRRAARLHSSWSTHERLRRV